MACIMYGNLYYSEGICIEIAVASFLAKTRVKEFID